MRDCSLLTGTPPASVTEAAPGTVVVDVVAADIDSLAVQVVRR